MATSSPAVAQRPGASALDLHEGITTPEGLRGCERWPEHLRLVNVETGELRRGRCRATNLCPYCRTLYTVETVEMLALDAAEDAPTIWAVLTAREHLTRPQLNVHLAKLLRAARRRWVRVEWHVQVEFQRRGALHANLLIKGVPTDEADELGELLFGRWCARVDAERVGQWIEAARDGYAVRSYLAKTLAHGMKAEQAPPIGWRGHRTSQTQGYLVRPAAVMREEARASLAAKRRLWRAFLEADAIAGGAPTADLIEVVYEQLTAAQAGWKWELRQVAPHVRDLGPGATRWRLGQDTDRLRREGARRPFSTPPRLTREGPQAGAIARQSIARGTGQPSPAGSPAPHAGAIDASASTPGAVPEPDRVGAATTSGPLGRFDPREAAD